VTTEGVRCILRQCDDQKLEFDLVFDDHYIKTVILDAYQVRAYRGAGIRSIIEDCARNYLENIGKNPEIILLTFI
jgi:hypothetical protein